METREGLHELRAGTSMALGSDLWCRLHPSSSVRLWTVYVHERFMREQIAWLLPDISRVRAGVHPLEWDGSALVLEPGIGVLRGTERLWRKVTAVGDAGMIPELAAARIVSLFAQVVELSVNAFLNPEIPEAAMRFGGWSPVHGPLTPRAAVGHVARAVRLLRTHRSEHWTTDRLASEVALSRTHLSRLFATEVGMAPMRYLTHERLVEFTRLLEETDLSVASAARQVGWEDSRVAATWFRRRFGVSPSEFRRNPYLSA